MHLPTLKQTVLTDSCSAHGNNDLCQKKKKKNGNNDLCQKKKNKNGNNDLCQKKKKKGLAQNSRHVSVDVVVTSLC